MGRRWQYVVSTPCVVAVSPAWLRGREGKPAASALKKLVVLINTIHLLCPNFYQRCPFAPGCREGDERQINAHREAAFTQFPGGKSPGVP